MKRSFILFSLIVLFQGLVLPQSPVVTPPQNKPVMLTGGNIHTGTGEVITNGFVAFSGGIITEVGRADDLKPDKSSYDIIDVTGKEVYPGLIFPNTSLGLVEIRAVDVTVDNRELGDLNPNVRSIVAYNTDSHVIPVVRSNGVLIAQIVPEGSFLPGTSSIVQLDAWNWEDAVYKADNGIQMGWPRRTSPAVTPGSFSHQSSSSANTYDRNVELLEKIFSDAVSYATVEKPVDVNPRLESLCGLFNGSKILFISAPDPKGIIASVSFAKRYNVKKIVLVDADESAWLVKDFLKENNIPVILSNTFSLPKYDYSDIRMPFKLAYLFHREGILTGLSYSSQAYPNLSFAAGQTVPYGLSKEEALQLITINNAKILGIDDRTGTLSKGKDANIVVSTGDILDMKTNNVELAFINGRSISLDNKHKQLYRRFKTKYENAERKK